LRGGGFGSGERVSAKSTPGDFNENLIAAAAPEEFQH
jgi:hypothetical protein